MFNVVVVYKQTTAPTAILFDWQRRCMRATENLDDKLAAVYARHVVHIAWPPVC